MAAAWKHRAPLAAASRPPPPSSASLHQAKCLRRAGAGDRGAPAAVRPGLHPHRQSLEAGLRRTAVVHGLRAEVRVLPPGLARSLRAENGSLLPSSSGEASCLLRFRGQSPLRRWDLSRGGDPACPSCCPGCGRALETVPVTARCPPGSLGDRAAGLGLSGERGKDLVPGFSGAGIEETEQFV